MRKMLTVGMAFLLMGVHNMNAQEITDMGHATIIFSQKGEIILEERDDATAIRKQSDGNAEEGLYDKGTSSFFNICWFTYQYPSISGDGQEIMLSALACMPDNNEATINNVLVGCHATIAANRQCPSRFNQTGNNFSDVFLTMTLAGNTGQGQGDMAYNNLVILPDYEGFGITRERAHPYLCEEITGRQVTDAVRAGIALYQNDSQTEAIRRNFRDDWRTICTGYSQGGAVAMATQRYIEQNNLSEELHLAGSLCGDGPYDPVSTILNYLEKDQQGKALSMPVVLPMMLKGLCCYDETLSKYEVSDFLDERFLETGVLGWLDSKIMSTDNITDEWKKLYEKGKDGDETYYRSVLTRNGDARLSNIMKEEALSYFTQLLAENPDYATTGVPLPKGGTPGEDLHLALEHNNLTRNWTPQHPLFLYHSTGDEVVPYENYESAEAHLGEWVTFYNSFANSTHVATGIEFFMASSRLEGIRQLATSPHIGIENISIPLKADDALIYDLNGRAINGMPDYGVFIQQGKKMIHKR